MTLGEPGFCPFCGTRNPPDYQFCENCERKLPQIGRTSPPPHDPSTPDPNFPLIPPAEATPPSVEPTLGSEIGSVGRTYMSLRFGVGTAVGGIFMLIIGVVIAAVASQPSCTSTPNGFGQPTQVCAPPFQGAVDLGAGLAVLGVILLIVGILIYVSLRE